MTGRLQHDRQITFLASRAHSVVHARDLRSCGVDRDVVARRIESGLMARMLPRVYAVGPQCHAPTFEMRCMAGVLHAGPLARVDGDAAARLYGAWDRGDATIDVTAPTPTPRPCDGYRFHRTNTVWGPFEDTQRIPLVPFEEACLRLACTRTKWQVAWVMQRGVYLRHTSLDRLEELVERSIGGRGIGAFREALELIRRGSVGTRGPAEDRLLDLVLAAGVPEPTVNMRGALGLCRDEPDFVWPASRLNVEVDGGHHDQPNQSADDRARDAEVQALGYLVARVPARSLWNRPSSVVRWIVRAVAGDVVRIDPETRRMVL